MPGRRDHGTAQDAPKERTQETFTQESLAAEFPNMTIAPADGTGFTMPTSNPVTRAHAGEIDDETRGWKIKTTRNAIGQDWAELAEKGLSFEQRKLIRERLQMRTKTLRQLVGPSWYASQLENSSTRPLGIEAVEKALRAGQPEPSFYGLPDEPNT